MKRIIYIQKIGETNNSVLISLKEHLELEFNHFNIIVKNLQKKIQLEDSEYNSQKYQYKADKILDRLKGSRQNLQFFRLLGVMDKDIYTKNLDFIFGQTRLFSRVALISITRLRESFYKNFGSIYKKPNNNTKFDLRVLKEAIHELGHTFGLKHCSNSCVMLCSNCLADTDNKPTKFCVSCLKNIRDSQII